MPIKEAAGDAADAADWTVPSDPAPSVLDQATPEELKQFFTDLGQGLARGAGGQVVAEMLHRRGWSLRGFAAAYGFTPKVLSEVINGKSTEGPKLATLMAIAEACDFDLGITLHDRKGV